MTRRSTARRRFLAALPAMVLGSKAKSQTRTFELTLYTFGDSILDCGHYNTASVHPAQLLVRNEDALFPEFAGRDLRSRGPTRLEHRARDGACVAALPSQAKGIKPGGDSVALLTIGGNDLLTGLAADSGSKVKPSRLH